VFRRRTSESTSSLSVGWSFSSRNSFSGDGFMVLPTLWIEGEYPLPRYGGECAASTASLWINYMPPRTTRKSYRPRVSDRTMVGTSPPHCLPASETKSVVAPATMNPQGGKNLRTSPHHVGWKPGRSFPALPALAEVFVLTSPFIERGNRKSGCQYLWVRNAGGFNKSAYSPVAEPKRRKTTPAEAQ
jgi:hypothetical protein